MKGFVGIDRGVAGNVLHGQGDAVGFTLGHERLCGAVALPEGDHHPALAVLIFGLATILPVFFVVRRADLAAEIGPVDLDLTRQAHAFHLCSVYDGIIWRSQWRMSHL